MLKKKKLLFISAYSASFVMQDLKILANHFQVKEAFFPKARSKGLFYTAYTALSIMLGVLSTDITYAVFADLRAFFAVFWCKFFNKKIVVLVGGYETAALPDINYGGMLKKGQASRFKYVLKNADLVLTYSDFSKEEVIAVQKVNRIQTLYLGIENEPASVESKEDIVVTIGDSTPSKWKLKGLDTFARATAAFPGMKIIIIGNYTENIRSELLKLNSQLEFTGYISRNEVDTILSKAKVYCQLSRRESFGLSVLEAMKFGAIPVVTEKGSLPEVVGDTGFFTEYGDVDLTISAIKKALQDGSEENARKRAEEDFTIKMREDRLIELVGNL
ncbi:glycosyltransferase family 4 protein [Candidatus Cloacimonadota bacterium]